MVFKKLKFLIIFALANFYCLLSFSQSYGVADFNFLVTKIKTDYPGYRNKRKAENFNKYLLEIVKNKTTDTFALLSKVSTFFNDLHLVIYDFGIKKFLDTSKCKLQKACITEYLDHNKNKNIYEGYWLSEYNNCIIGLKKVGTSPICYKGYVVETTTKAPLGYCVFEMIKEKNGYYQTDYKEEGLGYRIFLKSNFKNSTTLYLNSYGKWRKIKSYKTGMLGRLISFKYDITFNKLNKKTVLFTLPDFSSYNVKKVDSIVKKNDSLISAANLLIIDIRNNMGGTIKNYLPLIPYISTGQIIHPSTYRLCSDDAIADFEDDMKNLNKDVADLLKEEYKARLDSMLNNKGNFFIEYGDTLSNNNKILRNPLNVAIITNNNCLSAAELMLLDFKQSKKVKIFGEVTGGALDNLDALKIKLPNSGYTLFIATTKRVLKSSQPAYDNKGIKPDISIPDSVKNWVEFVKSYYECK